MKTVEIDSLVVRYNDFEAVKGISFSIDQGEIFGLLGPNGAGKTSTLEIIEGLREKTSGQVKVFGIDPIKNRIKVQEELGVLVQGANFFNQLKVSEIVSVFSSFYKSKANSKKLIEKFLPEKQHVALKKLSSGQKQKQC